MAQEFDPRWLLATLAPLLPAGNILAIEGADFAPLLLRERGDMTLIPFSHQTDLWLSPQSPAAVCMGFSPSKELVFMQLCMMAETLPLGIKIYVYGANKSGIKSLPKLADAYYQAEKIGFGGHAELWVLTLKTAREPQGLAAWQHYYQADVAGQSLILSSCAGVFGHEKLDEGTALLLEQLPLFPDKSKIHDMGCGNGLIGAWVKQRQPDVQVSASDINALAVESTRCTFAANKLTPLAVTRMDGITALEGGYTAIISNPPFHSGQAVTHHVSAALFADAPKQLAKGGTLYVVGNRFLPYAKAMEPHFKSVEVLAQTSRFWVIKGII